MDYKASVSSIFMHESDIFIGLQLWFMYFHHVIYVLQVWFMFLLFAKLFSKDCLEVHKEVINASSGLINSSSRGGVSELELILKQKTFTRQVIVKLKSTWLWISFYVCIVTPVTCTVETFFICLFICDVIILYIL